MVMSSSRYLIIQLHLLENLPLNKDILFMTVRDVVRAVFLISVAFLLLFRFTFCRINDALSVFTVLML